MIDLVICTYNNAASLDRVLCAIAGQESAASIPWRVLVVDNNCTDETPAVLERHQSEGRIPALRRIVEPRQGLTPARHRGVMETTGEWVAFVDDDNLLAPDWVARMAAAAREHPAAGAIGGRVVPTWDGDPPSYIRPFGWCYAAQDHGAQAQPVGFLVGAGLMIRRHALAQTGWIDQPLLEDRIGRRLVSGGDVEIALRIRAAGFELWYDPACALQHLIPAERTRRFYLLRMAYGLGVSQALSHALTWSGTRRQWRSSALRLVGRQSGKAIRGLARAAAGRGRRTGALVEAGFAAGMGRGAASVLVMDAQRQRILIGRAAYQEENRS